MKNEIFQGVRDETVFINEIKKLAEDRGEKTDAILPMLYAFIAYKKNREERQSFASDLEPFGENWGLSSNIFIIDEWLSRNIQDESE